MPPIAKYWNNFFTNKLMEAEVREAGITVADKRSEWLYASKSKKNNSLSEEDLKTALSLKGSALASYKA